MKRMIMAVNCLLLAGSVFAQTESSSEKNDTLTVGNFIILKKNAETPNIENSRRDPMDYEYNSRNTYHKRYYRYNEWQDIPAVSKLVDQIVDAAVSVGDYFSGISYYRSSSSGYYKSKPHKIKKSYKHPVSIKINGDRYVSDKTDDKDSD